MLNGVRLRLTLLYAGAALLFLVALGGGSYALLNHYFEATTDLALQHKMAHEFLQRNAPVPAELVAADRDWVVNRNRLFPQQPTVTPGGDITAEMRATIESEEALDGELAAIFVLPLTITAPLALDAPPLPLTPDRAAAAMALQHGHDWRTVQAPNGTRVRLLTYRIGSRDAQMALQAGRTLGDQDRVLRRLLEGLAVLGSVGAVLIGFGGWWLAGRALQPAQQAWAQQQTFVANASHELRAPLTLLRASAEVVQRGLPRAATDSRALLDDVLHECDYMSHLMDDLLLLSRLDAKRLPLEHQPVALHALFTDMTRQIGRVAAERLVAVRATPSTATVLADPTRLRQVLLIVLDNALRYTPAGGEIRLTATTHGREVRIGVADTGCGIAPEQLPHLFERFYRADPAHSPESGGSGLGLAIAQALISAQHGHIGIASTPGGGTQVWVTLPSAG